MPWLIKAAQGSVKIVNFMTKVKGRFWTGAAIAVISCTMLTSCDLRVKKPVIINPPISVATGTDANDTYPDETPSYSEAADSVHSDNPGVAEKTEMPVESSRPDDGDAVSKTNPDESNNPSASETPDSELTDKSGVQASAQINNSEQPSETSGNDTEDSFGQKTDTAKSPDVVSTATGLISENISGGKTNPPSSKASATAKVAPSHTPTPAPTSATQPKQSPVQETHSSNVQSIAVGTVEPVKKTPVPAPTPARNSAFYSESCSMTDYTKQALPNEKFRDEVTSLLASAANGSNISISTKTKTDIEAILYSHRYLTGVSTITLYSSGNNYTIGFSFDNPTKVSHYKSTLDWASKAVSKLGITKNTLKKDALEKINKYICEYVTYDYKKYEDYLATGKYDVDQDVWSAINSKSGICEHYAQMFMLICHKCGIEAYYEANYNMSHAYNYVVFGDGTRYYFDCTWNDSFETATFNIGSASYVGLNAAADGLWSGEPANTIKRFGNGLVCDKQGFIDYHSNLYLNKFSLLPRNEFISAHVGWSLGNKYYSYESHDYR